MIDHAEKLTRALERILAYPDRQRAESEKEERQLPELAFRLLRWDGESEELD